MVTTGIGSLPHPPHRALQLAFEHDLPFLPQRDMISAALEPHEPQGLRPFLDEVSRRKLPRAKVQLAGPVTLRAAVRTDRSELGGLLMAKALALLAAVRSAKATPVLFFDEPGLIAQPPTDELRALIAATKAAGAVVGLHCCGNADWARVLELEIDVLSIDARLSLDALLEEPAAVRRFLRRGATLALGAVPTDPKEVYVLPELVAAIETALRSTGLIGFLPGMWLSPACGLGLRTEADAERIIAEVCEVKRQLSG